MKKILYWSLFLLTLIAFLFDQSVFAYTNEEQGFSIDLPSGWSTKEYEGLGPVSFLDPSSSASIMVLVVEVHGTLLEYVASSKLSLDNAFDNYTLISEGSRIVGGLDCYEFELIYTLLDSEFKMKSVMFVEFGNAFLLSFGATASEYENMNETFEASLSTFRITDASNDILTDFYFLWITSIVAVIIVILVIAAKILRKKNQTLGTLKD